MINFSTTLAELLCLAKLNKLNFALNRRQPLEQQQREKKLDFSRQHYRSDPTAVCVCGSICSSIHRAEAHVPRSWSQCVCILCVCGCWRVCVSIGLTIRERLAKVLGHQSCHDNLAIDSPTDSVVLTSQVPGFGRGVCGLNFQTAFQRKCEVVCVWNPHCVIARQREQASSPILMHTKWIGLKTSALSLSRSSNSSCFELLFWPMESDLFFESLWQVPIAYTLLIEILE